MANGITIVEESGFTVKLFSLKSSLPAIETWKQSVIDDLLAVNPIPHQSVQVAPNHFIIVTPDIAKFPAVRVIYRYDPASPTVLTLIDFDPIEGEGDEQPPSEHPHLV